MSASNEAEINRFCKKKYLKNKLSNSEEIFLTENLNISIVIKTINRLIRYESKWRVKKIDFSTAKFFEKNGFLKNFSDPWNLDFTDR